MLVSTKGRYAIRVMVDLAENSNGNYVSMKEIAARQKLSLKYMTKIMPSLTNAGLVDGIHGKGGGYKLSKEISEYSIKEILEITEGDYAPVTCLEKGAKPCDRKGVCKTVKMWVELYEVIDQYFENKKLSDLL